jgi:hypothetical protein
MNFRSTHNGDGEGVSLAGDVVPFSSPARRAGQTDDSSFPRSSAAALAAEGSEGAGVSSASASSFKSLGDLTHAVVLRLAGGYPKIRGPVRLSSRPHRPSAASEGEEDAG